MPRTADRGGAADRWGMFTGMGKETSNKDVGGPAQEARSQLAVRVPRGALREFKLACVRSGVTMQAGAEEALLDWVRAHGGTDDDE